MKNVDLVMRLVAKDQASDELRKVGNSAENVGSKFSMLKGAVAALSAAGVVAFAMDSVRAFAEAEAMQVQLEEAYRKFPAIADVNIESLRAMNEAIQAKTGADADSLAAMQAVLARYELTGSQLQELTPLVNDFAIATGRDLTSSAEAIGKALMGNARALKDIGVDYKTTGDRALDTARIMDLLAEKVGGAGEAFGQTAAGKLKIMEEAIGDMKESVGESLMPTLEVATDAVVAFGDSVGMAMDGLNTFGEAIGQVLGSDAEEAADQTSFLAKVIQGLPGALNIAGQGLNFLADRLTWLAHTLGLVTEATGTAVPGSLERAKAAFANTSSEVEQSSNAFTAMQGHIADARREHELAAEAAEEEAKALEKLQAEAARAAEKIRGIHDQMSDARFEASLRGMSELEAATARYRREREALNRLVNDPERTLDGQVAREQQRLETLRARLDMEDAAWAEEQEREAARRAAAEEARQRAQQEIEDARRAAEEKAAAIRDALQRARDEALAFAKQISDAMLSFTALNADDAGGDIASRMKERVERLRRFGTVLGRLKKAGLSNAILQEIIGIGPEEGLALADGLLSQGVGEVNALQTEAERLAERVAGVGLASQYGGAGAAGDMQITIPLNLTIEGTTLESALVRVKRRNGRLAFECIGAQVL